MVNGNSVSTESLEKTEEGQQDSTNPSTDIEIKTVMPARQKVSGRAIITLAVLVYINLLNYMDRFTVSSVLVDIQHWFNIEKKKAGLLQTIFVCAYMVFAPIFGYLGDRFSRKYVMAFGITIWSITTYAGSLMGREHFWGFFALRGLVGIGEASYSTVAPTIIADLFVGERRSIALSVFYFAIPCGGGLGYIVGSKFATLLGGWQWALRVTPALGLIAVLLTLIAVHEPPRGVIETEGTTPEVEDLSESVVLTPHSSYIQDLRQILNVPSFIWATAGFTCVSFVVGALAWWAPEFAFYAEQSHAYDASRTQDDVSYIFGIVTFVSGILGVWIGAESARRWKVYNAEADALVCAIGIISSIPFLFFALYTADKIMILSWILIAFGEILMCMNWAPNGDLLLYVIPPNCRSTAEAIQILIIHVLGDAFSPFVVGAISDAYTGKVDPNSDYKIKHLGLLYALYSTPFISVAGAVCYFICAKHVPVDKANAEVAGRKIMETPPESILNSYPTSQSPFPDEPEPTAVPDVYADSESDGYDGDTDVEQLIKKPAQNVRV